MSRHRWLLAALLVALAAPTRAAEPMLLNPAQMQSLGIETAEAGAAPAGREGSLPARVLVPVDQMRIVAAPVDGRIEMLAVAPGMSVRAGQTVARLASPEALALQRDALQARNQSALLDHNRKRDEQLFAEGLIPESRLQATRAAAAQARALASERTQALKLAGITPGKLGGPLTLSSPIDGVVLAQNAEVGERVSSTAPIYRIAQLSPLWLEIQAPLTLARAVREGMAVRIAGTEVSGKVIAVGRAVDPESQTVLLRAAVDAGAERLHPGQVVEVSIDANIHASGQRLPASALAREGGRTLVFVRTATGADGERFEAREVTVLGQGGDTVVVDGVKAGETVAVQGVSGLKAMLTGVGAQ
ncbi:efflux RND transporter periplasmic adaptor subunit [Nitrogeniibacter mangrovi]|uniref:Efflux RND transporter periplasmic adaptor subunit n=1 Tax=Nitrogeniibacter mangrovi TaxID=2016596 RepID=A0A6C1B6N1_9RHOO|nr:efflux RND transporter periplasmic adaptor subunit [Nitrogeniibacter mangrovi]QID19351.1 efflux RND transporter periplasmic adaptor subunit [Nitrogeniibacter mangrovi]